MAEEDKPFICVKSGWSMQIKPRNGQGWRLFGLWMSALLPLCGFYMWSLSGKPSASRIAIATLLYVLAMTGWAFAMIRWMMARSEMVDMKELLKLKRELDEQKQRGRR